MGRTRRQVLKGIGAAAVGAAVGCGKPRSERDEEGVEPCGPPELRPPEPVTDLSPEELLAPIDTVVVLMMENRSFDHYLGSRRLVEGCGVDGLTGVETNPDPDGNPVGVFVLDDFTPEDPPHGWSAAHAQWNNGANDGFVKEHAGPSQEQVMGYHLRSQLPTIHELADRFTVCDRWFCSVLGPTWPNRFYLHGATSGGIKNNSGYEGMVSVFDLLDDAGIPSRTYFHDLPFQVAYGRFGGTAPIEQFFQDAADGTLPAFSIIDPQYDGAGANDDHPDHDIRLGQALMATIYAALASSPQWERCLFVLTYDENGGFYDHVPPPTTVDAFAGFEQLGFRVPGLVMGPYVRAGSVARATFEHVSVIATLTHRFGLTALNERVTATHDLSRCIDPARLRNPLRAPRIAPVTLSVSNLRARFARSVPRHHPELLDLADRGGIPRNLDRRAEGADVTRRVLEAGRKLGAIRLVD